MATREAPVFNPEIPPDIEHAALIREEALDWLERQFPGGLSFGTGDVLRMAGQQEKRWLIARLRDKGIGNEELFSLPDTADALAVLFLRSRGVKFREAVDAVVGGKEASRSPEPRYGGVWNRLVVTALERLRRHVPARLLGTAVFSLLRDQDDHANCLIIVKRLGRSAKGHVQEQADAVSHDHVYRMILERPAPSCSVIAVAPAREILFFGADQLPARSEVTSRHFVGLTVTTEREVYELLLGTMHSVSVPLDAPTLEFVGRILDLVFIDFEEFHRHLLSTRLEAASEPESGAAHDLQLWLITQFLDTAYPGSLSEISEAPQSSELGKVLASSVVRPWEPPRWDPPKRLEMLSGYASRVGVPLVVDRAEHPWTSVIASAESELRYLKGRVSNSQATAGYSALALPVFSSSGSAMGALYLLMPEIAPARLDIEVRILTVFSRVIGETIERQKAAIYSAEVSTNIATFTVFKQEQFKGALLDLLSRKADEIHRDQHLRPDLRLPFLLLSAHGPDHDEYDLAISGDRLKSWLVDTLRHLEWRSFIRSHWAGGTDERGAQSFIGELPGVGVLIALDRLVSKDELDRIRSAFPTTINRTFPTNAPVKFLAWVLDVPAQRIMDAAQTDNMQDLADDVERWAFDVASVVEEVALSTYLYEEGEWDAALRGVRKALQKKGGRKNGYLYRLAAECSFSVGDWPSALKYAQDGVALRTEELGSGFVRSRCQEADAHFCLGDPVRAWDLYSAAAAGAPTHPLPRYYRGQALTLMAKLLREFENERLRSAPLEAAESRQLDAVLDTLVNGALEDLTSAADLLDRWGLIPESYQYRNFHLVPTLLGQGVGYLLARSPGPAASRLQSARRSFPKDELFFREYLFAKCWEQGLHRRYGALLLGDGWAPLRDRLHEAFGEPRSLRAVATTESTVS